MKDLIALHLGGLLRFHGREARLPFWLWVALVVGVTMTVWTAAMTIIMARALQPGRAPDFHTPVIVMAWIILVVVALLAAAVVRRLHDSGRRGWWGLMPLPFLTAGMVVMNRVFSSTPSDDQVDPLFGAMMLINLVYLAALALLVVLCCLPSQTNDNRWGAARREGEAS